MLSRVQSSSNPSNVVQRLSLEPSQYLENLKMLITKKQEELNAVATRMKKSVEVLEENTQLMKNRLITLEAARKTLEEQVAKNNQNIQNNPGNIQKIAELEQKNAELRDEKSKIEKEISDKLEQVHSLENSIEEKEKEWNNNKSNLLQHLKQFQETQLLPSLDEIEKVMKLTNSKIDASNTKLKKYLSGDMEFGSDPFVSIGQKFKEKLVNNEQLFGENHFGNNDSESEDSESDKEMKFGEESDSDSDSEESKSDKDMKFGIDDSDIDDSDINESDLEDLEEESEESDD